MKIVFLIILFFFNNSTLSSRLNCHFKVLKNKNVPFANFSLVPNSALKKLNQITCFTQCMKNEFCSFVVYKNDTCSLHTEYALKRLVNGSNNVVFVKNLIIDHCQSSPCMNGATCENKLNGYECLCSNEFFGLNCSQNIIDFACDDNHFRLNETDSCKPCNNGFMTFNNYPFNCYLENNRTDFESAKLFCKNLDSHLFRPKTLTELSLFRSIQAWVDSKISYVGEPFVWPDGSKVTRFGTNEPDNRYGNESILNENVLVSYYSNFYDINQFRRFLIVCQKFV